jgi:hypothetical protein
LPNFRDRAFAGGISYKAVSGCFPAANVRNVRDHGQPPYLLLQCVIG